MECTRLMRAYGTGAIKIGGQRMEHLFDMSLRAHPQLEGKDRDLEKQ
jgi:hypothetical protein